MQGHVCELQVYFYSDWDVIMRLTSSIHHITSKHQTVFPKAFHTDLSFFK